MELDPDDIFRDDEDDPQSTYLQVLLLSSFPLLDIFFLSFF